MSNNISTLSEERFPDIRFSRGGFIKRSKHPILDWFGPSPESVAPCSAPGRHIGAQSPGVSLALGSFEFGIPSYSHGWAFAGD